MGKSNCLFFAVSLWFRYGGKIKFYKSENWFGKFHVTWISKKGREYSYTPKETPYISLWQFLKTWDVVFEGELTRVL